MKSRIIAISILAAFFTVACKGKKEEKKEDKKPVKANTEVAMKPEAMKPEVKPEVKKPEPPKVEAPKPEPNVLPVESVVYELEGKVEVKKANTEDYIDVTKDMKLNVGDQLRVGEGASAKLRMWDETTVVLGAGAEVVINPGADMANGSPSITVLAGTSSIAVEPRSENQSVFKVFTPTAVLSVLGTEFDVGIADTGATKLGVEKGIVEVSDQEGAKKIEVPAGKQVEVGVDGKPTPVAAYDAEKEDWSKWYAAKTKEAEAKVDAIAKSTTEKLEAMKKQVAELEAALKTVNTKAEEMDKKVVEAESKNNMAAYTKEAKPYQELLEEKQVAAYQEQRLNAMVMANAYLLQRLKAMVRAGVIKPSEAKAKIIEASLAQVTPWLEKEYYPHRYKRYVSHYNANKRWKTRYLRHHPRGRNYNEHAKVIVVPKFYAKVPKVRYVPPRNFKPRYVKIVKYHDPYRFKGKVRKNVVVVNNRSWHRAPYKMDPIKVKRYEKARKRMHRRVAKRTFVIKEPVIRVKRHGVTIRTPGARIDVPGGKIKVGPGGTEIRTPGGKIKVGPGGTVIKTPGGRIKVGPGGHIKVGPQPMVRKGGPVRHKRGMR
ncbi:FecR domain-containing protein [Myxococcota bacterium]|nr:FecR domain-containing protein [Myxococcota bacterium]MBU1381676.1 FecR domain-containing protein [Myxococcota bacterium]MBU1496519.1 FecR domain-containing protein [Myxococcota bacterium]